MVGDFAIRDIEVRDIGDGDREVSKFEDGKRT